MGCFVTPPPQKNLRKKTTSKKQSCIRFHGIHFIRFLLRTFSFSAKMITFTVLLSLSLITHDVERQKTYHSSSTRSIPAAPLSLLEENTCSLFQFALFYSVFYLITIFPLELIEFYFQMLLLYQVLARTANEECQFKRPQCNTACRILKKYLYIALPSER